MSSRAASQVKVKREPDGSAAEDTADGHVEQKAETVPEVKALHQTEIEKLHSDRTVLRKQLKETQAANGHLQKQVAELKSTRDAEVEHMRKENEALRAQINQLEADRRQRDKGGGQNRFVGTRKVSQRPTTGGFPKKPQASNIHGAELCARPVRTTAQNLPMRENTTEIAVQSTKRKTRPREAESIATEDVTSSREKRRTRFARSENDAREVENGDPNASAVDVGDSEHSALPASTSYRRLPDPPHWNPATSKRRRWP